MSKLFEALTPYLDKSYALSSALTIFSWDNSTIAPKEAIENTSRAIGLLSVEYYGALVNEEVKRLLLQLTEPDNHKQLTFEEQAIIRVLNKQYQQMAAIPPEEFQAYNALVSSAYPVWEQAKANNDYASYAPVLEQVIAYKKKFAAYTKKDGQSLYDVALDDYEEGFTVAILDEFFSKLRTALVPLVQKVNEKKDWIQTDFLQQDYDIEQQKSFCRFLAEYVGFDFNRGTFGESEHPFTTSLHNHDVRITNHFYQNRLDFAIFSVIHESGHALYEQGVADEISLTPIGCGTSMGMHESQSRFYENNLGRSLAFWTPIYAKLQQTFPTQLEQISLEQFYRAVNHAQSSLIRTEADELTYPFHIMIRYEIEKEIFSGDVSVHQLPALWNDKYKQYLGITPPTDTEGILQDMHWACGNFGYFPSYALGSAIAAQIYHHLAQVMPLETHLKEENLQPIRAYLQEHIHRFGMAKRTREMLQEMTGEDFCPDYYIAYLTEKYSKLYDL